MDLSSAGFELPKPLEPEPAEKSKSTKPKIIKIRRVKVSVLQRIININNQMKGLPSLLKQPAHNQKNIRLQPVDIENMVNPTKKEISEQD